MISVALNVRLFNGTLCSFSFVFGPVFLRCRSFCLRCLLWDVMSTTPSRAWLVFIPSVRGCIAAKITKRRTKSCQVDRAVESLCAKLYAAT